MGGGRTQVLQREYQCYDLLDVVISDFLDGPAVMCRSLFVGCVSMKMDMYRRGLWGRERHAHVPAAHLEAQCLLSHAAVELGMDSTRR